jgi:tRNA G26 N,N-dimethylase Trm1
MDEYISRNELLKDVNSNVAEADNERCAQILEAILNAPTADVVPKSEVEKLESEIERLKHILNCYALQYGTVKDQQDVTEQCPDCKHFVGCEEAIWVKRCEDFDFVRKEDDAYEKGYNDALKDVQEMILECKNENTPKI